MINAVYNLWKHKVSRLFI